MRHAARACLALLAFAGAARAAHAQTPSERFLARGVQAARDLEYDSAGTLLREALAHPTAARLSDTDRSRALAYLGATEVYRGRRDSATAAFRRLLIQDPRYRPDQLIFPPEVTSQFDEVRQATKLVLVVVPPRTEIVSAADGLAARLVATSAHQVTVTIAGDAVQRTLYSGAIGDSLDVHWDGRDSSGTPADNGRYVLRVTSSGADRLPLRTVVVPLEVRRFARDTLPLPAPPADSLFRPEQAAGGPGTRSLLGGALAAAAVVALPSFVNAGGDAAAGRFLVAGAAGIAGIVGFTVQRKPQPIPENIAANQALRLAWQRRADQVRAENTARRRDARLVITAGPVQTLGLP